MNLRTGCGMQQARAARVAKIAEVVRNHEGEPREQQCSQSELETERWSGYSCAGAHCRVWLDTTRASVVVTVTRWRGQGGESKVRNTPLGVYRLAESVARGGWSENIAQQ
jgi:hypothetical protein